MNGIQKIDSHHPFYFKVWIVLVNNSENLHILDNIKLDSINFTEWI